MNDAYAAGIVDGEGCLTVGLNRRVMVYDARVYIGMTERAVSILEDFRAAFGGTVKRHREATEKWQAAWMWAVTGRQAGSFLGCVIGHLKLKAEQARLLIQLENMRATAAGASERAVWTGEMRQSAACIRATVMDLNRKGPEPPEPPFEGLTYVRDVDGMLMSRRKPDKSNASAWQPWPGRWPNTAISAPGGYWMLSTSECPSGDAGCSGCSPPLASILETEADWLSRNPGKTTQDWFAYVRRYSLSDLARAGILRRAEKRGRKLPALLEAALKAKAPG